MDSAQIISDRQQTSEAQLDSGAASRTVEAWSGMRCPQTLSDAQKAESQRMEAEGYLDFGFEHPLLAQASKQGPSTIYENMDEAAKHAFKDNDLMRKSQQKIPHHEHGFWLHKAKDSSGRWGHTYSQPFEANGGVINKEEWQAHDVPAQYRGLVEGMAHTHPNKRGPVDSNYGLETFSPNDLVLIEQSGVTQYIENAYGQIRKRQPGETADTLVAGPKEPTKSLKK